MFTICFAVYASLTAVDPIQQQCVKGLTKTQVSDVARGCDAWSHDPITTCEMRRAGALKYFVTVRHLEVS